MASSIDNIGIVVRDYNNQILAGAQFNDLFILPQVAYDMMRNISDCIKDAIIKSQAIINNQQKLLTYNKKPKTRTQRKKLNKIKIKIEKEQEKQNSKEQEKQTTVTPPPSRSPSPSPIRKTIHVNDRNNDYESSYVELELVDEHTRRQALFERLNEKKKQFKENRARACNTNVACKKECLCEICIKAQLLK